MINDQLRREAKWSEGIAVGDRAYVEAIEQQIRGRQQLRVEEQRGSWILQDCHDPFSRPQNSDIEHRPSDRVNSIVNSCFSSHCYGPTRMDPRESQWRSPGAYSLTLTVIGGCPQVPQTLTVMANGTNKIYGSSNPVFTWTYSGFVNGDGPSVISGSPSLTTLAMPCSPVG